MLDVDSSIGQRPLTQVQSGVPVCPEKQHRDSNNALAICQPRLMVTAVIRMFTGTTKQDGKEQSKGQKQKQPLINTEL